MSDFNTEREITARTPKTCEESGCRRTRDIQPGTRYVRVSGRFEGYFYAAKFCLRCRRAQRRAWARFRPDRDEGPALGELLYWLREERLNGRGARCRPEAP